MDPQRVFEDECCDFLNEWRRLGVKEVVEVEEVEGRRIGTGAGIKAFG